jgi:Helix-turn-helix domain
MTWLAGQPTSRPGANPDAWWNQGAQRRLTVELTHLIWEAPLDLTNDERRLLWALWRHDRRQVWPTDRQWAERFEVTDKTIRRWRRRLIEAGTLAFHRPYNIPDGRGGWKAPRQTAGVYDLKPPSQWRYRSGWRYCWANAGWLDADGAVVNWPAHWPGSSARRKRGGVFVG